MSDFKYIGERLARPDALAKTQGRYRYLGDALPGDTLYGALLLSPHAHARVSAVDASRALGLPGISVLTFEDAPSVRYNSGEWFPGQEEPADETILTGHVRHVGDRVALVLAPDRETARAARDLIDVAYDLLPPCVSTDEAEANAANLHDDGVDAFFGRIAYGDTATAFASADFVETDVVSTPKIHHAAMEPHNVFARPAPDGGVEVHTPCQILFGVQHLLARVLDLPLSQVRVVKAPMGGTFGGKQEPILEPLAAWAALKLARPVFIDTTREESMLATRTRLSVSAKMSTALDRGGKILARRVAVTADAGAYLSGSKKVMMAMGKKIPRLYRIPALDYEGRAVRTTTTPAGACRGYGSPQIHAITEIHTDLLCRRRGLDPVGFRKRHFVHPFDEDPTGASNIGNAGILECLDKGLEVFGWKERCAPGTEGRTRRASGFACCTHGNGYAGTIYHDVSSMSLRLLEDGSAVLRAGVPEFGHAAVHAMAQIVAEVTGIPPRRIAVIEGDSLANHYDIGCQASRGIYVCGECARLCAEKATELLTREAGLLWDALVRLKDGELLVGDTPIPLGEAIRRIERERRVPIDVSVAYSPDHNPASFGAHFVELSVDTLTGLVSIEKYVAVHDVGRAINKNFVEGQICGGVQMGIGMALMEELAFAPDGTPGARNFDKYHMPNAPEMPDIEVLLVENGEPHGPFGAKSIGEIATVPTAPAIVNAINRALGTELTELPLTPAKIVNALSHRKPAERFHP